MKNKGPNNIKLGVFVISGVAFLILMLYMIGRNQNLFQSTYTLKAHLKNAQGLVTGNNVRYAGIEIGTVHKIKFLNDTLIEVSLNISDKMKDIIRKNAKVSVGSEGLVGNKVLNISPSGQATAAAVEGDVLAGASGVNTDDLLLTLEKTNKDVAIVVAGMRTSIERLNNSRGVWKVLDDEKSAEKISRAAEQINSASRNAAGFFADLETVSSTLAEGRGTAGMLLNDTFAITDIRKSLKSISSAAQNIDSLTGSLNRYTNELHDDIENGHNILHVLLKDSVLADKLTASMFSAEKGTASFTENMEALKHNVLLRRYFKAQDKKKRKLKQTNPLTGTNQ